jgi:phage terminase large subunit-like protein
MSYEQDVDKFAGVDRDGTWFDEEPPFAIYQECQMRHIGKKGRTVLSFTADKGVTWVYDMFYLPWILGSLPSHIHCWRFSMRENRTLDPAEIELAAQSLPSEFDRRTKLDGEVVHRTGLVFPEFQNREPWVFNMFHIPTEWPRWVAIDPHPRKPHGLLLAALSPSGELWFYDCHLTSNTPAPNCHFLKAALKGLTPQVILIDPSSKGYDSKQGVSMFDDYLDELSYVGLDCGVEALKELDLGIVKMRTGFEWNPSLKSDRQIPYDIAPPAEANGGVLLHICRQTCAPLITQLLKYSYPALASRKSEDRGETVRKPKDKDNDLIDPMRYIRLDTLDWVPVVASPRRNIGMAVPGDDEDFEEFPDPEYETDWMEA